MSRLLLWVLIWLWWIKAPWNKVIAVAGSLSTPASRPIGVRHHRGGEEDPGKTSLLRTKVWCMSRTGTSEKFIRPDKTSPLIRPGLDSQRKAPPGVGRSTWNTRVVCLSEVSRLCPPFLGCLLSSNGKLQKQIRAADPVTNSRCLQSPGLGRTRFSQASLILLSLGLSSYHLLFSHGGLPWVPTLPPWLLLLP